MQAEMVRVERSPQDELPKRISPMLLTEQRKPFDREGWFFEAKLDGYRGLAAVVGDKVDLYSKNKKPFNLQFSEIVSSLRQIKHNVILDGEIVVVDEKGIPNWEYIQKYRSEKQGIEAYYVFDILSLDGNNLMESPLWKRKQILKEILPNLSNVLFVGPVIENGIELFNVVKLQGLEGIVAKDPESIYKPGERSKSWIKIKNYVRHGWKDTHFR